MSIVAILVISIMVLLILRRTRGLIGQLAGSHQMMLAILLPVAATFWGAYPLFALSVIGAMLIAPAVGRGGLILLAPGAIELRARLFLFALPLLPILTKTIAISGLTLVQLCYRDLLSMGLLLSMLRAGSRLRIARLARWDAIFLLMMAAKLFMDARGNSPTFALRAALIVVLDLGLPYLVVSRACHAARRPDAILLSLVIGGCVLAVMTPVESLRHWLLYDSMTALANADATLISGYTKQRDGLLRAAVSYGESTGLSLLFGLLIVMLTALRQQVGSKMVVAALTGVLAMGLVFTFARIGYIVVGAGLVACFVYERRMRNLIALAVALPTAGGALLVIARFVPTIAASLGTSDDAAGSVDYRSNLLHSGLRLIRENWVAGLDLADILSRLAFLRNGEQIVDLVNEPLVVMMRAGLFGAIAFFAIFVAVVMMLFVRGPRFEPNLRAAGCACFAGLIGMMASLTTTSFGRNEVTYVVLLAAGAGIAGRRIPARTSDVRRHHEPERVPAGA